MDDIIKAEIDEKVLQLKGIDECPISEFTEELKIKLNEVEILSNKDQEAIYYFKEMVKINCLSVKELGWF